MDYKLASKSWDADEYQAILGVFSGDMYKMGHQCEQFEINFAAWTGSKYAVFCNSGSSANMLAVASMKYDPRHKCDQRKEVIVPAVSWPTTYYPLIQMGYTLVFVDVQLDTFNIDVNKIEEKITDNTRAIFSVNLLGNSCNYKKIKDLCKKYHLYLLEDNCESMGARYLGQKTGTFGDISTHSTFFSHHISTMEGGVCTTDDEVTYELLRSLRAHGWTRDIKNKKLFYDHFTPPKNEFFNSFHFVMPGFNFRPTEVQAAIGIQQLKKINNFISNRIDNAKYLCSQLTSDLGFCLQVEQSDSISSWFGFGLIFSSEDAKNFAVEKLGKFNIECRPIVSGNILKQPVFSYIEPEEFPNADILHNNGIMLGNHQFPIVNEINYLLSTLND